MREQSYFTNAARLMWMHKLIIPRGYNNWVMGYLCELQ